MENQTSQIQIPPIELEKATVEVTASTMTRTVQAAPTIETVAPVPTATQSIQNLPTLTQPAANTQMQVPASSPENMAMPTQPQEAYINNVNNLNPAQPPQLPIAAPVQSPIANTAATLTTPTMQADPISNKSFIDGMGLQFIAIVLVLLGTALLGTFLVKLKSSGKLRFSKEEKIMEVISSINLSPKRQILLVKIRNTEIVLSSTEQGITVLKDMSAAFAQERPLQEPRRLREFVAAAPSQKPQAKQSIASLDANKRSEILLNALQSMKDKNAAAAPKAEVAEAKKGNFPKYLAQAFEKTSSLPSEEEDKSIDKVTDMIRQKLKSLESTH